MNGASNTVTETRRRYLSEAYDTMIDELYDISFGYRFECSCGAVTDVVRHFYIVFDDQCDIDICLQECVERVDMASVAAVFSREHETACIRAEPGIVDVFAITFGCESAINSGNPGYGKTEFRGPIGKTLPPVGGSVQIYSENRDFHAVESSDCAEIGFPLKSGR